MSIFMSEPSCMGMGTWPEVMVKSKHIAGDIAVMRVTGGRHVWMPAEAAGRVRTGTKLKVAGGGLPLQGLEHLGVERAVLASQDSLFDDEVSRLDASGRPLCVDCGSELDWLEDKKVVYDGHEVEFAECPGCGKRYQLSDKKVLMSPMGKPRHASRNRGRQVLAGEPVNVGAAADDRGMQVDVGGTPGVAMARAGDGFEIVLVNPSPGAAAALEDALSGFGDAVSAGGGKWVIDTSSPFTGRLGPAYVSLVKLHRLISQRGVPPSLFRDLRDWVAGRS